MHQGGGTISNDKSMATKAAKIPGIPVPLNLSSLRFRMPDGSFVMGANIPADQLSLDVPGSTNKLFSYTLDPAQRYQTETVVTHDGGIVETNTFAPETGISDKSPNLPRNQFSGKYDEENVYLLPPTP